MTRKRFKKLLRSHGYDREMIEKYSKVACNFYKNYEVAYNVMLAADILKIRKDYDLAYLLYSCAEKVSNGHNEVSEYVRDAIQQSVSLCRSKGMVEKLSSDYFIFPRGSGKFLSEMFYYTVFVASKDETDSMVDALWAKEIFGIKRGLRKDQVTVEDSSGVDNSVLNEWIR